MLNKFTDTARRKAIGLCEQGVRNGLPPKMFGWRWVREETLRDYFTSGGQGDLTVVHTHARASNPLPVNIDTP